MAKRLYPRPGTHAESILEFVQTHDGTTTNGIIAALKLNPSVVRKCLRVLMEKGSLVDRPDASRNHHYSAKVPAL
jgi:DNA-binding IclR family transcriptional regulator